MSIRGADRWRSGSTHAMAVLAVLVGVFAMHGLTGNHDVTMVEPHMSAMPITIHDSSRDRAVGAQNVVIAVDEHQHAMTGACLAILTALMLLLTLSLGLRSLLVRRAVQLATPAERPLLTGRSPPWLVPSLSKLCVLRT
jgi:hypothetical protein